MGSSVLNNVTQVSKALFSRSTSSCFPWTGSIPRRRHQILFPHFQTSTAAKKKTMKPNTIPHSHLMAWWRNSFVFSTGM